MLLLVLMPALSGCEGCRQVDPADQSEEKNDPKAAPLDAFTTKQAIPLPSSDAGELTALKPGHWFTLRQSIRSNQADQRGDLNARTFVGRGLDKSASHDENSDSLPCQRPAVLPKGRMKRLDTRLLAGRDSIFTERKISTSVRFTSPNSFAMPEVSNHQVMHGDEYFFVILTNRSERFAAFQVADWVRPPFDEELGTTVPTNYRIVFPRTEGLLGLPETVLDWTSTAIVFWDDVSPSELTTEQKRALIDWLHFGGRMIVNGDTTATDLANSDLNPLLPISVNGMNVYDSETMTQLIDHWSVEGDESRIAINELVRSQVSRIAISGELSADAKPIDGTSDLVASRAVGRGEVVMSRFDLTSKWMDGWRSRDSFFNAAVLARPGRNHETKEGILTQSYVPNSPNSSSPTRGPDVNTSLRFVSRDARLNFAATAQPPLPSPPIADSRLARVEPDNVDATARTTAGEFSAHPIAGLCGWRDDSDAARLMVTTLRDQAGVKIPRLPFAIKALAIYLLILIPLNYIVFRLLGKLEWAWLAVPFIAIAGAGWVAKTVSLDLGLARNYSEVSLVEIQPGYARAHLTRFNAIYNSLSGNYQIKFATPDAAAGPVSQINVNKNEPSSCVFRYGYEGGPSLENFAVPSNRSRMFHAEQMIDVGGAFEFSDDNLINRTDIALSNVIALRKSTDGSIEYAAIGELKSGSRVRLKWAAANLSGSIDRVAKPFADGNALPRGGVRLVGQTMQPLSGMEILPSTPQQNSTNIVIAHLTHPAFDRSDGDLTLIPTRKQRDKLLLDQGIEPGSVKEIIVP